MQVASLLLAVSFAQDLTELLILGILQTKLILGNLAVCFTAEWGYIMTSDKGHHQSSWSFTIDTSSSSSWQDV